MRTNPRGHCAKNVKYLKRSAVSSKVRVSLSHWEEKWHLMESLQSWSLWWTCHCLLISCRQEVSVQFIWWQVAPCINESTTCNHINLTNTQLKELHCNIDTQFVIYFLYRTMTGVKCVQVYYVLCCAAFILYVK